MPPAQDPNTAAAGPDAREAALEILRAVRRNLVRVVFTTLVFLMLGMAVNMIWPSKFESASEFQLVEQKIITDAAVLGELKAIPLVRKLQALQNEIKSTKRVGAVMDELQWRDWLETAGQPAARRKLLKKIQQNLKVQMNANVTGAISVTLAFQWTSARDAAEFVNRLRDSWIKLVLDSYRKGVDNRREDGEQRRLEREREYQAALAARQKYEEENEVLGLLDMEQNNRLKAELLLRLTESRSQLEATITQIEYLQTELKSISKTRLAPAPAASPEEAVAMAQLDQARVAFEESESLYRPGHWKYDAAERVLNSAIAKVGELGGEPDAKYIDEPNPIYVDRVTQLRGLESAEVEYKAQIGDLEAQIRSVDDNLLRLPRVTNDLAGLQTEVDLAQQLLSEATLSLRPLRDQATRLRNATAVVANSANIISSGPFEILEVAIEPDAPVLPIGSIIMALSLLAGIGFGLSGPVLTEVTRSSFGSVKEVSRSLGVPVLGAVDLILTTRDVRARTVQSVLSIATMVLVLLALGTALYMYANHQDALPTELLRALKNVRMALT